MNIILQPSTETMLNINSERLISLYIHYPGETTDIFGSRSLFIEGERGTGKSMILKVFEITNKEKNIFPIFINWEQLNLIELDIDETTPQIKIDYITFKLFIEFLNYLEKKIDTSSVTIDASKVFPEVKGIFRIHDQEERLDTIIERVRLQYVLRRDAIILKKEENYNQTSILVNPGSLYNLVNSIIKGIKREESYPYENYHTVFLFDEYDTLKKEHQKIVNSIIINRHENLSYKIAFRPHGITYETIGTRSIQIRDIPRFSPNIFSEIIGSSKYVSFFRDIANARLEIINQMFSSKFDISKILGDSVSSTFAAKLITKSYEEELSSEEQQIYDQKFPKRGKINFYGFRDVALISSGIIGNFLELVVDLLEYMDGKEYDKDFPIDPQIQSEVIRKYSESKFKDMIREIENKSLVEQFIQTMGSYFAKRLHSRINLNAISAFRVSEPEKLSKETRKLLDSCVKHSLIQVSPLRKSKDGTSLEPVYHINKVFGPVLNIIPLSRDTISLTAEELNKFIYDRVIFKQILDKKLNRSVKKRSRKFIEFSDGTQTTLDDFF